MTKVNLEVELQRHKGLQKVMGRHWKILQPFIYYFLFMCFWVSLCVSCVYRCSHRSKKTIKFPRTEVTGGCETLNLGAKN